MPEISWFPVKAPKRFETFIEGLQPEQRIPYVGSPNKHQNILDLVFTRSLNSSIVYIVYIHVVIIIFSSSVLI